MASYNRVILMGNLTRDVELRNLQSGNAVADMGLAVNERFKNRQGEWEDKTNFVDCTLWGRTAEVASEYLSKGSPVHIEGRLSYEQWESDGQKRSKLKVTVDKLTLIGGKKDNYDSSPAPQSGRREADAVAAGAVDDDDVPF